VEKLQTISTKFRRQQETGEFPVNFMRHYYDVCSLLSAEMVQAFIGTDDYKAHKDRRFRSENHDITKNEAFVLSDATTFAEYEKAYEGTKSLYYRDRPEFVSIMNVIKEAAPRL